MGLARQHHRARERNDAGALLGHLLGLCGEAEAARAKLGRRELGQQAKSKGGRKILSLFLF